MENISWNEKSMESMVNAQLKINEIMLAKNFPIPRQIKNLLDRLQDDMMNFGASICDCCGNKQSRRTHMNIEHATIKVSWGYESMHDGETHKLTLCNTCYDKHIMEGSLGKYIKITQYM